MINALLPCTACGTVNQSGSTACSACGQSFVSAPVELSPPGGLLTFQRLLNDRYRVIDQIGKGGFGAVYKAADTQFGDRLVAIKEMAQKGLDAQELAEAVASFKHEALLLANLQHPHLPRIYDHFSDLGRWYLVMDYIEGETLEAYMQKIPRDLLTGTRHLVPEEVLTIGIQLCTVLDYLHTRQPPIVFRDLKPANVMCTPDNHLYLIDFGIARHFKSGQIKDTVPLGSPGYAAPEQYGTRQTTSRADIYSLGVMLHQLLTGNDPANTPFRLAPLQYAGNPALSRLETLIKQMVDLDEETRPATVALVKEELQEIARFPLKRQVWSLPPEAPESERFSPDSDTTASGQQMAQQIQQEGPQQEEPPQDEQPIRSSRSRRAVIISLVGLAIAGGITWQWLTTSQSAPVPISQTKPVTIPKNLNFSLTYNGHTDRVSTVAWSPNNKFIASASADRTVQISDAVTGQHQMTFTGHTDEVTGIAWSPDGKFIVSSSLDKTLQLWNSEDGTVLHTFSGTQSINDGKDVPFYGTGWSTEVDQIFVITPNSCERIQVASWQDLGGGLGAPVAASNAASWSPHAPVIAVAGSDHTVVAWNINTEIDFASCHGHTLKVMAVDWSPDGTQLASGSLDKTVRVWKIPDLLDPKLQAQSSEGVQQIMYTGHTDAVLTVAWSPDGTKIASVGIDKTVQVWDVATGKRLFVYQGHSDTVTSVAWSPDGEFVVSGSDDHTVRIWPTLSLYK